MQQRPLPLLIALLPKMNDDLPAFLLIGGIGATCDLRKLVDVGAWLQRTIGHLGLVFLHQG